MAHSASFGGVGLFVFQTMMCLTMRSGGAAKPALSLPKGGVRRARKRARTIAFIAPSRGAASFAGFAPIFLRRDGRVPHLAFRFGGVGLFFGVPELSRTVVTPVPRSAAFALRGVGDGRRKPTLSGVGAPKFESGVPSGATLFRDDVRPSVLLYPLSTNHHPLLYHILP